MFIFERWGGEKESQAGFAQSAQSLMQGLNPLTMRSRPEPKSGIRHLTDLATKVPLKTILFIYLFVLKFIYFENKSKNEGGGEREGERT